MWIRRRSASWKQVAAPGFSATKHLVDVEAPEIRKHRHRAAEEPPKKKKRFDPFADLPPPKKKAAPAPKKPPTPEPEEKAPVKVFTSGLFKLEQVHCLHIVRKHKDARNPTSWRHPGRRIDRTRQDATDGAERCARLSPGWCSVSFFASGDGGRCRRRRVDGVYVGLRDPIIRGLEAPPWAGRGATAARESAHTRIQRPHTRENAIDTTRHRRKNTTRNTAPATRRSASSRA